MERTGSDERTPCIHLRPCRLRGSHLVTRSDVDADEALTWLQLQKRFPGKRGAMFSRRVLRSAQRGDFLGEAFFGVAVAVIVHVGHANGLDVRRAVACLALVYPEGQTVLAMAGYTVVKACNVLKPPDVLFALVLVRTLCLATEQCCPGGKVVDVAESHVLRHHVGIQAFDHRVDADSGLAPLMAAYAQVVIRIDG